MEAKPEQVSITEKQTEKQTEVKTGFLSSLYEGLYKIPVVNRVVGKIVIAYNQHLFEKHDQKVGDIKKDVEHLELKKKLSSEALDKMNTLVETLRVQGVPYADSNNDISRIKGEIEEFTSSIK